MTASDATIALDGLESGLERATTFLMKPWRDIDVNLIGLKLASLMGVTSMLVFPSDPQFYVACTTAVTVAGSVLIQLLKNKQEDRRYERDRQERIEHQEELKLEVAKVAAVAKNAAIDLKSDIKANTELTRASGEKAEEAYTAANHVSEKFAILAKAAGVNPIAVDTNKTVHRIEDKS